MIIPQHIQTQLYELISHRFDSIQIDRLSMDKPDWNLSVTGKYSFILSVRKTHAFKVMRSSDPEIMLVIGISKTDQFESHAWICKNDKIILGGEDSATKFTKLVAF